MSKRNLSYVALITCLIIGAGSPAFADTINYGDFMGVTMSFNDVTEQNNTPDPLPLFGAPHLVGDSLVFYQMSFRSYSEYGSSDSTDGQLTATVQSKNNSKFYIDKLTFQEVGDLTLTGSGTSDTYAEADCSIDLVVLAVDGGTLLNPIITVNMTMSEDGHWDLADPGTVTGRDWNGYLQVDLTSILLSRGCTGHATQVAMTLDNTLATGSEANTTSLIAKKVQGLSVTPILVPEPTTLALLAMGGLFLRKRKK